MSCAMITFNSVALTVVAQPCIALPRLNYSTPNHSVESLDTARAGRAAFAHEAWRGGAVTCRGGNVGAATRHAGGNGGVPPLTRFVLFMNYSTA